MTCTKCQQPIRKGERFHRTKKGPHHRDCHSTPGTVLGPIPPVLMMDGYKVRYSTSDDSKRLIVIQEGVGNNDSVVVARIHIPSRLLSLLAKAIGGA